MKRNTLLKSITVSVALSAFLAGCGSSTTTANNDDNNNNDNTLKTSSISGKAIDGYLQFATVCLDMDQDGYCQATEPSTQTDENGSFSLTVSADVQKDEKYDLAMLLVYGGKDVDTGDDFKGKLLAPKDGKIVMVTPINTLIAKAVQKELKEHPKLSKKEIQEKIAAHRKRVAQALEIPEEEIGEDPVKLQKEGKPEAIEKALQLQKAVETLLVGDDGTQADHERAEKIYEALVDGLADMQPDEKGVEKLIDKTLQKAQKDTRVKELIGGESGLKLGKAAKSVAQNVKDRFQKFKEMDPEEVKHQDFLKKIAAGTDMDLQKVKTAFDEGQVDNIARQMTIDNNMFTADFDWDAEYLKGDLLRLGIKNPDQAMINKLKALLGNQEKIHPGILIDKKERLSNSNDPDIQKLYNTIEQLLHKKEQKKEQEHAKQNGDIIKVTPPMTIFMPEKEGYGKVTFGSDNILSFQKYNVQQDGTFAPENGDEQNNDFVFQDGQWVAEEDGSEQFTLNTDGSVSLPKWNEKAYLVKAEPIAGKTKKFPQYHTTVSMPDDAEMYFVKIKKLKDTYMIDEAVNKYTPDGNSPYTSISDFIENQCGTNWFEGDNQGGLAFAGVKTETGYSCDGSAQSGKLVLAENKADGTQIVSSDAGTWEIKTLEGDKKVLVVKPYNMKRFHDDEGDIEYPIFTMKDNTLYRGSMEPAGVTRMMPAFNESAMKSITQTITENWSTIVQNMPASDFENRHNNQQ